MILRYTQAVLRQALWGLSCPEWNFFPWNIRNENLEVFSLEVFSNLEAAPAPIQGGYQMAYDTELAYPHG